MSINDPEYWRQRRGLYWLPNGVSVPGIYRRTRAFIEGFHDAAYRRGRLTEDPQFESLRGKAQTVSYDRGYDAGLRWLSGDDDNDD